MTRFNSVADAFFKSPEVVQEVFPSQVDLLMVASKAIDLLEGRSLRHGIRVTVIAGTLATMMGLDQRSKTALLYAGLLHDVGLAKMACEIAPRLPQGLTEKDLFARHTLLNACYRGNPHAPYEELQLSEDGLELLKAHPQAAASFVNAVYLSGEVNEIIEASHELIDGSGYPHGLSGDAIPLGARILSFADTLESIMDEVQGLSARRQAAEHYAEIKAANKFDPQVIEAFKALCNQDTDDFFFRNLFTLNVEELLNELFAASFPAERRFSLSGEMVLNIARAIGGLADGLLPHYTQGHSEKTALTAALIARQLGIGEDQCGQLILSALLHDMGMLRVPLNILMRSDSLTKDQWAIVYDHPRWSEEILKTVPGFDGIATWAGEHHERMNGSGYHGGRRGYEISVAGRILAIADVYSALTSPRPYRTHAYEPMDALPVMEQGRFRFYDSQLISVLKTAVRETPVTLAQ